MKIDSKSYKITIDGEIYTLVSDENEAHVQLVGSILDAIIRDLKLKSPNMSSGRLATLAAIQCTSQMIHAQSKAQDVSDREMLLAEYIDKELAKVI